MKYMIFFKSKLQIIFITCNYFEINRVPLRWNARWLKPTYPRNGQCQYLQWEHPESLMLKHGVPWGSQLQAATSSASKHLESKQDRWLNFTLLTGRTAGGHSKVHESLRGSWYCTRGLCTKPLAQPQLRGGKATSAAAFKLFVNRIFQKL